MISHQNRVNYICFNLEVIQREPANVCEVIGGDAFPVSSYIETD